MVEKLEYSSKKNATKLMMFVEGMDYSVLKLNGQVPHLEPNLDIAPK